MATSTFDFDTDGNAGTRNNHIKQVGRSHHGVLPDYNMGNDNDTLHQLPPNSHQNKHGLQHGTPTKRGTMDMETVAELPRPLSDYHGFGDRESESPIYHHANPGRVIYANSTWNLVPGKNVDDTEGNQQISLSDVIGVKDVCGNKRLWRMLIAEFIGNISLSL